MAEGGRRSSRARVVLRPNSGCVHWLASPSALCLLEACSSAWACKTNDDEPVSNRSCGMASWRICAYLVLLLLLRLHRGGRLCSRRGEAGRVSGAPIAVVVRFQRPLGLRTTAANASDGRCKSKNSKRAQDAPVRHVGAAGRLRDHEDVGRVYISILLESAAAGWPARARRVALRDAAAGDSLCAFFVRAPGTDHGPRRGAG